MSVKLGVHSASSPFRGQSTLCQRPSAASRRCFWHPWALLTSLSCFWHPWDAFDCFWHLWVLLTSSSCFWHPWAGCMQATSQHDSPEVHVWWCSHLTVTILTACTCKCSGCVELPFALRIHWHAVTAPDCGSIYVTVYKHCVSLHTHLPGAIATGSSDNRQKRGCAALQGALQALTPCKNNCFGQILTPAVWFPAG